MTETHLHRKAKIVGKESSIFGTPTVRHIPKNMQGLAESIGGASLLGEFGGDNRRPQRPKGYALKLVEKHKLERIAHAKSKERNAYKRSGKKKMTVTIR